MCVCCDHGLRVRLSLNYHVRQHVISSFGCKVCCMQEATLLLSMLRAMYAASNHCHAMPCHCTTPTVISLS